MKIFFNEAHTIIHSLLSRNHNFLFWSWLRCMHYMCLGYIHANEDEKVVTITEWAKIQEVYPILKEVEKDLSQYYES